MDRYVEWLRGVLRLAGEIYFQRVEAELRRFAEEIYAWLHLASEHYDRQRTQLRRLAIMPMSPQSLPDARPRGEESPKNPRHSAAALTYTSSA
jgi:hypothetical protein